MTHGASIGTILWSVPEHLKAWSEGTDVPYILASKQLDLGPV